MFCIQYSSINVTSGFDTASRSIWEDNINMDLWGIGIDGAKWIRLAQDRVR